MINFSTLSDVELKVVDWLEANNQLRLKDFFLADLSWADNKQERTKAFVDFFIDRMGKQIFDIMPDDLKDYVMANNF